MDLVIHIDDRGQVSLTGPIDNKLVCYGLLEVAKEIVADHHRQQQARLVQPSTALPLRLT